MEKSVVLETFHASPRIYSYSHHHETDQVATVLFFFFTCNYCSHILVNPTAITPLRRTILQSTKVFFLMQFGIYDKNEALNIIIPM